MSEEYDDHDRQQEPSEFEKLRNELSALRSLALEVCEDAKRIRFIVAPMGDTFVRCDLIDRLRAAAEQ